MSTKRKILLITLIVLSVFLGFPIVRYGLLLMEISVWRNYLFHGGGLTAGYWLLPFGHLLLLSLFPLASKSYFGFLAMVFPFVFLLLAVFAVFIFFFMDTRTLYVLVPFVVVWVLLIVDAFEPNQGTRKRITNLT